MPWQGERKQGLPKDWSKIRMRVLRRDGYRCQWPMPYQTPDGPKNAEGQSICGREAHDVDHRVHRDDHRIESLWALCSDLHHARKTQREAAEGRAKAAARRRRT